MISLPSRISLAIAAVALMLTALVASPTNASPVRNLPTPSRHRALRSSSATDISKVVKYTRLRNRVYSPELGRFLSRDPIGFSGGSNLYAYVGNDPVGDRDPTGFGPELNTIDGLPPVRPLSIEAMDRFEQSYRRDLRERQVASDIGLATTAVIGRIPGGKALLGAIFGIDTAKSGIDAVRNPTADNVGRFGFKAVLGGIAAWLGRRVVPEFPGNGPGYGRNIAEIGTSEFQAAVRQCGVEALQGTIGDRLRSTAGFGPTGTPLITDQSLGVSPEATAEALRAAGFNARSVKEIFGTTEIPDASIRGLAEQLGGRVIAADRGRDIGGGFGALGIRVHGRVRTVDSVLRVVEQELKGR